MNSIREVFDTLAGDLRFDKRLAKNVFDFERAFVNYNEDHIAFFGGYSMGVYKMRFRIQDRENWFNDIMHIDPVILDESIEELPTVNSDWVRASDGMNLSCVWMAYRFLNSTQLSQAERQEAATRVIQILLYKFMGSLMSHNFPYTADEGSMDAMYRELNYKFAIKKAGSWGVLLRQRAEELVSNKSVHRRVFEKFDRDDDIIRMINDTQSRLRQIVKSMNKVFYDVRARGVKINTSKSVLDMNGETVLLDKTKKYNSYIRYIHKVLDDKNSFVRSELTSIVGDMMHTMSMRTFTDTLEWMAINHGHNKHPEIEKLVDETLIYAFDLMANNREELAGRKGISPLLARLRALYMASRMADPALLECKRMAEHIVVSATGSRSASTIASVKTGIQIYIVLRTMAMNYYQS